uniref:Bacterial Ig-like domain-containing protein n=1 Tax=Ralstonia solanacearum TaxID=305 RepID=A0A0S4XKR6_RALSL|nr:exported protein of unknown function [Ralstonia solanacearum]
MISILAGAALIGATVAEAPGNWTFTPIQPLADGNHSLTATATDPAGNVGTASSAFTLTVDTAAPAAPVISTVTDNVAPVTGAITAGGSTNDAMPVLTGTAEANSTVSILDGTTLLGTTTADASGNWTFTPCLLYTSPSPRDRG